MHRSFRNCTTCLPTNRIEDGLLSMNDIFCQFQHTDGLGVVIEGDDRAAYAYLLLDQKIVGDVWLFNRSEPPCEPEWEQDGAPPFMNSREAAIELPGADTVAEDDFRVVFSPASEHRSCAVYFRGLLIALLWPGSQPGKSAFSKVHTPAALRLDVSDEKLLAIYGGLGVTP